MSTTDHNPDIVKARAKIGDIIGDPHYRPERDDAALDSAPAHALPVKFPGQLNVTAHVEYSPGRTERDGREVPPSFFARVRFGATVVNRQVVTGTVTIKHDPTGRFSQVKDHRLRRDDNSAPTNAATLVLIEAARELAARIADVPELMDGARVRAVAYQRERLAEMAEEVAQQARDLSDLRHSLGFSEAGPDVEPLAGRYSQGRSDEIAHGTDLQVHAHDRARNA